MKLFSATYPDFIHFDKKPNEDFFLISKKYPIFLVADGVTQSHFKNGGYAYPNGARKSAEIFCYKSLKLLEKTFSYKKQSEKDIKNNFKDAFNFANHNIMALNIKYGIDKKLNYVEYDWFDTVGIAGIIVKNRVYYGYVGDCGLIIFDKKNKKKFQTKDMVRPAVNMFKKMYSDCKTFPINKRTLIMHRDFRNRKDGKGYGSFSGESEVEKYYKYGSKELNKGDLLVFYTDGFFEHLKDKKFVKIVRVMNKKDLDNFVMKMASNKPETFGNDRTFVSMII